MKTKFTFLGVGNMARAIIGGLADVPVCLYDKDKTKYNDFTGSRFTFADSAPLAVMASDYILLCVKPQNFDELLTGIKNSGIDLSNKVFISIGAGITIDFICEHLGCKVPCIRTMPNTPLLIGKGVTALTRNELVSDAVYSEINGVFSSVGITLTLPEDKMNSIISVTSSSPAYVCLFIKALYNCARMQGIECDNLLSVVCKTVAGSAEMAESCGKTPDELIRMVTSPNGTTEKAMEALYEHEFEKIIEDAMLRCTKRADELSRKE